MAISATVFGFGAGIFFLSYFLFEVPSNLLLEKFGARRWIARIMITWGVIAMGMAFVKTPLQFYAMRFALGAAEAGFFPGVLYYVTLWFPEAHRGRAIRRLAIHGFVRRAAEAVQRDEGAAARLGQEPEGGSEGGAERGREH